MIAYRTEWNGLDPVVPTSHWIDCDGQRVDLSEVAWEWGESDLAALEATGFLLKLRRWEDPRDRFDTATFYLVSTEPQASVDRLVGLLHAARVLLTDAQNAFGGTRWSDVGIAGKEVTEAIGALRRGSVPEISAWFTEGGAFRRVGRASGWDALGVPLAERIVAELAGLHAASGRRRDAPAPAAASTRRDVLVVNGSFAGLILLLILFFLINQLPPNPIGESVQDWFLRRSSPAGGFGVIESAAIFWLSLVGMLIAVLLPIGLVVLFAWVSRVLRGARAPSPPSGEVSAPHEAGAATGRAGTASATRSEPALLGRPWGFHRRRVAAAIGALSTLGFGVLWAIDSAESRETPTPVFLEPGGPRLSGVPRHVEIHASARGDLRSAIGEHTAFHGKVVNTTTVFSGVRTDFKTPGSADDVVVPLVPAGWSQHQPIELFLRVRRDAAPSSFGTDGVPATELRGSVALHGTLHRRALPLFVVNSYRRAGFVVADTYYVLEPELSPFDKEFRRWAVLIIGWGSAVLLFAWSFVANPARRKRKGADAGDAGSD